jgi:hypothetical protein
VLSPTDISSNVLIFPRTVELGNVVDKEGDKELYDFVDVGVKLVAGPLLKNVVPNDALGVVLKLREDIVVKNEGNSRNEFQRLLFLVVN